MLENKKWKDSQLEEFERNDATFFMKKKNTEQIQFQMRQMRE